ncbi:hypothetical protein E4Z66_11505 [Aliishimia ponticola]|uniref:Uncharacterized protein n=1 Tax=Aliishimia ponticola TaxID=2499833 RepID=A0A4S4NB67_9RHOB|nr:hypothetical protein [Aliishimia ponticola]THH35707.1 hypothetical protein E4Z66_11505 [Aliishimia ponticola]
MTGSGSFGTQRGTLGETRTIDALRINRSSFRVAVRQVSHDLVDRTRCFGDLLGAALSNAMLRPGGAHLGYPGLFHDWSTSIVEDRLAEPGSNDPLAHRVVERT